MDTYLYNIVGGTFPKHRLNDKQVESYKQQEKIKRQEMLQKYLNLCHDSKVILLKPWIVGSHVSFFKSILMPL